MNEGDDKCTEMFCWKTWREETTRRCRDVDGRTLLKWIWRKQGHKSDAACNRDQCQPLENTAMNQTFQRNLENSWLDERLSTSEEGLSSVESVRTSDLRFQNNISNPAFLMFTSVTDRLTWKQLSTHTYIWDVSDSNSGDVCEQRDVCWRVFKQMSGWGTSRR